MTYVGLQAHKSSMKCIIFYSIECYKWPSNPLSEWKLKKYPGSKNSIHNITPSGTHAYIILHKTFWIWIIKIICYIINQVPRFKFLPPEQVVARYRDPQLVQGVKMSYLCRISYRKLNAHFSLKFSSLRKTSSLKMVIDEISTLRVNILHFRTSI